MAQPLGMNLGPAFKPTGLKSTGYKEVTLPTMNAEQQRLTSTLHQLLGSSPGLQEGLKKLGSLAAGSQEGFSEMEAPSMRQLNQLLGSLGSRFSGMGTGARQSSGFQNTLGEAGADLAERLASQRMGYQQNALAQLLGLSESLLGRPTFQSVLAPKKEKKRSFWKDLFGSSVGGLSKLLPMLPFL